MIAIQVQNNISYIRGTSHASVTILVTAPDPLTGADRVEGRPCDLPGLNDTTAWTDDDVLAAVAAQYPQCSSVTWAPTYAELSAQRLAEVAAEVAAKKTADAVAFREVP